MEDGRLARPAGRGRSASTDMVLIPCSPSTR